MIISLIEPHKFSLLQVPEFGDSVARIGISWINLPIRDVHVPDDRFESGWSTVRPEVLHRIGTGERILIHCRGGLGRTGAIETLAQEQCVLALQDQ